MRRADVLILAAVLTLFWCAAFYQIGLPGLYYDEAADVVAAMQIVEGDPNPLDMAYSLTIGPLRLPVMVMIYVGAVSTYAVLPLYWLFGVSVEATRAMTILMASLSLIFSYLFLKELFDRRVAALTVLLAAVHPSFVFWSRMGIYVSSPMLTMATASLFCLLRWRTGGQARYLYAAALLMGLGLSAKLLFLWFILAVLGAALLLGLWPKLRVGRWLIGQDSTAPIITTRMAAAALGWFAAGAWMLIVYNLFTRGTVRFVLRNMMTTGAGVNNLDITGNLRTVFGHLGKILSGSWHQNVWGPAFTNHLLPIVFFAALAILAVLVLLRRLPWPWRRAAFVILLPALIWAQSAFTITGLGATHLYIIYPFPQAIIVLATLALAERLSSVRHEGLSSVRLEGRPSVQHEGARNKAVVLLVVAALLVSDGWAVIDHHRALSQSGGARGFSDVVYDLVDVLEQHNGPVAAVDWGFRSSVALLSKGSVWPMEVFGFNVAAPQDDFAGRIQPYLSQPDAWLLFHAPQSTSHQGRLAATHKLAAAMRRTLVLEHTLYQRDGKEIIYIYRTEEAR